MGRRSRLDHKKPPLPWFCWYEVDGSRRIYYKDGKLIGLRWWRIILVGVLFILLMVLAAWGFIPLLNALKPNVVIVEAEPSTSVSASASPLQPPPATETTPAGTPTSAPSSTQQPSNTPPASQPPASPTYSPSPGATPTQVVLPVNTDLTQANFQAMCEDQYGQGRANAKLHKLRPDDPPANWVTCKVLSNGTYQPISIGNWCPNNSKATNDDPTGPKAYEHWYCRRPI
jgi:hypothetical protein